MPSLLKMAENVPNISSLLKKDRACLYKGLGLGLDLTVICPWPFLCSFYRFAVTIRITFCLFTQVVARTEREVEFIPKKDPVFPAAVYDPQPSNAPGNDIWSGH